MKDRDNNNKKETFKNIYHEDLFSNHSFYYVLKFSALWLQQRKAKKFLFSGK